MDSSFDASTQHIKDFKLAIEFKYLMKHAPVGIYLLPEFDNIRVLHGVIFVRRGLYRDGIFRFRVDLPMQYNDINTHPLITFTPPIFNPLVDITTGRLELTADEALREWHPERHFIVTAITFLKKAFYTKSYDSFTKCPNSEAKALFQHDQDEFLRRVSACVTESQHRVFDMQNASCPLVFTEPKPAHEDLIRDILYKRRPAAIGTADNTDKADEEEDQREGERRKLDRKGEEAAEDRPTHIAAAAASGEGSGLDLAMADMEQLMLPQASSENISNDSNNDNDLSVDSLLPPEAA